MSTFHDSAYRRARKDHKCCACGGAILRDHLYLNYAQGQRSRLSVCLTCSVQRRPGIAGGYFKWDCQVVRARVEELGDAAVFAETFGSAEASSVS